MKTKNKKQIKFKQVTFKLRVEHAKQIWILVRKRMKELGYPMRDVNYHAK